MAKIEKAKKKKAKGKAAEPEKKPAKKPAAKAPAKKAGKASWMKRGSAAQTAMKRDEQKAEQRKNQKDNPFRFWIPGGEETSITFLDGDLDSDGMLDCLMFHEHQLKINGSWKNWYTCTQDDDSEPCPICEDGNDPSLVAVFTIIDHSVFEGRKDTYRDTKKLFICKRATYKKLQKIASKRGGLTGCTFDVSRTDNDAANVGDMFDFDSKNSMADIAETYDLKKKDLVPFDYETVIPYQTQDELRELGFGSKGVGKEAESDDDNTNYAKDM